jgi:hypothetical protein
LVSFCGESWNDNFFAVVRSDADTAPPADEIVQIGLRDPDSTCEPVSYDVAAPHGPANGLRAEPQLIGGLFNG